MRLRDLFRKAGPGGGNQKTPFARTWSQAPRSETTRLPQLYHQSPRLDPVELIASTIANSPVELFDKAMLRKGDDAEPVAAHPFYELLEAPTAMFPELDEFALKYFTVVLCELLGECFWIKIREGRKITELLPMPPAWCISTPTQSNARFLFQPFGTTAGKTLAVAPEDVVWFKQPDITDPYGRGRGRTEALGGELDADEMAEKWQKNYFYNDATPPIWANIPGASTSDLERMRDTWGQRLGGWLNARKPAFTNGEGLQITKLGETPREMDFVESRRWLRDVFLQHYSIPPEMFGIIESSNRSTIDAAHYLFAKNVITRRLGFYERAITRQLVAPDYDVRLVAKIKFDIPEDEVFKLQKVNEGLSRGALTRADWKKAMGYKVDSGDQVYLVPMSMVEVAKGQPINAPNPVAAPEVDETPVVEIEEEEEKAIRVAKAADARKVAHWKAADNRAKQGEGMFRARTRAFAEVQSERVKKELAKVSPKEYESAIKKAFVGADEALVHAYAPAWIASMTEGAEAGRDYLGLKVSPSFSLYNKLFDQWVKKNGLKKSVDINTTTYTALRERLAAAIAEGVELGETMPKLAQRVLVATDGVYEKMTTYRAEAIARTETMMSVNYGQEVVYEAEGVEQKEWLSTTDDRTRDSHAGMSGKVIGVSEEFEVPGYAPSPGVWVEADKMEYPCGGNVAGQVINCRCTLLPVIPD